MLELGVVSQQIPTGFNQFVYLFIFEGLTGVV